MKKLPILLYKLCASTSLFAQNLIIKDINIIPMTSNTVLKKQSVLVENGKIKAIGAYKKLKNKKTEQTIDGAGKYLLPGLADMHVHLPEEDKIEQLLLANIAAGVTQIRVMNSKVSQIDLKKKWNNHLIGPNIHFSHLIRRNEQFSASQADSLMMYVKENGIDFVKLLSLSDERSFEHLSNAAKKHHVTICGHYPVYEENGQSVMVGMEKTLKSNFKSIEHLNGYIWLQDPEQIENALKLTKEHQIYNCPTLDWDIMAYDLQYPNDYKNRITYQLLPQNVTKSWENDYLEAVEKAGGAGKVAESKANYVPQFELKLKVLKKLYDNGCLLLIGGDAGNNFQANGFNVYEEMVNWKNAGIDNFTILQSATATASQFFNEQSAWGTIEVGKNAEMIILSKNPLENIKNITTIETTIMGDKIYNNKELRNKL